MSNRIVHLVTESSSYDECELLALVLASWRSPHENIPIISVGHPPSSDHFVPGPTIEQVGQRQAWPIAGHFPLQRSLERHGPDGLVAWGISALTAALAAGLEGVPLLAVVTNPLAEPLDSSCWARIAERSGPVRIACTSRLLLKQLARAGLPEQALTLLSPAVNIAAITQASASFSRSDWDIPDGGALMVTAPPPSREGGHFFAAWATAILHQIRPQDRLIIPGRSREQTRIRRLIETIYCPQAYRLTEDRYTLAQLLRLADLFLFPAVAPVEVGSLLTAMAADVPIVATATPAVTEFLRDEQTALLTTPGAPHPLALRIREALERHDHATSCARNAYEIARQHYAPALFLEGLHALLESMRLIPLAGPKC